MGKPYYFTLTHSQDLDCRARLCTASQFHKLKWFFFSSFGWAMLIFKHCPHQARWKYRKLKALWWFLLGWIGYGMRLRQQPSASRPSARHTSCSRDLLLLIIVQRVHKLPSVLLAITIQPVQVLFSLRLWSLASGHHSHTRYKGSPSP